MLFEKISEDLKNAMKARNQIKLDAIRFLYAQIKKDAIDKGNRDEISDELVVQVLKRRIKQGKDSIEKFSQADRQDLVDNEKQQLEFLEIYMPQMMSEEEIVKIAKVKIEELKIEDISKKGQLMGSLMKELKGNADGSLVKRVVDSLLS